VSASRKLRPTDRRDVYGDLFCGGGGFSKGLGRALEKLGIKNIRLIAINHMQFAVETHKANHPWAEHYCARVDQLDPRKLVPGGRMKLLLASPECTNHANARGGRPINDQSRATAWDVPKWAQELYIETILVENVREIMKWGPLGANGRPLESKKGEIFRQWLATIEACGYNFDHRILNAADYGAATTRQRFFLIARRKPLKIYWPVQTHSKDASRGEDLFQRFKPWRGAWEIINWARRGTSIFGRKYSDALVWNTIKRIEQGVIRFTGPLAPIYMAMLDTLRPHPWGANLWGARSTQWPMRLELSSEQLQAAHAFIVGLEQTGANGAQVRHPGQPLFSITKRGRIALAQAFILQQQSGGVPRSVEQPSPAISTKGAQSLVLPFVTTAGGPEGQGRNPKSVEEPVGTVMPDDHKAIALPFIAPFFGEREGQAPRTHDVEEPAPTVTSHGAGALIEPYVCQLRGTKDEQIAGSAHPIDAPLNSPTAGGIHAAVIGPSVVQVNHGTDERRDNSGRVRSTEDPLGTVTGSRGHALLEPMLVNYNGTGRAHPVSEPIGTITTVDRFGLVELVIDGSVAGLYRFDILFRMLDTDELERAMGFEGYEFKGTKEEKVLMIGNAVEVNQAEALCTAILSS
jgi:DNA (cytosine-5)-methyltransferase 1